MYSLISIKCTYWQKRGQGLKLRCYDIVHKYDTNLNLKAPYIAKDHT